MLTFKQIAISASSTQNEKKTWFPSHFCCAAVCSFQELLLPKTNQKQPQKLLTKCKLIYFVQKPFFSLNRSGLIIFIFPVFFYFAVKEIQSMHKQANKQLLPVSMFSMMLWTAKMYKMHFLIGMYSNFPLIKFYVSFMSSIFQS